MLQRKWANREELNSADRWYDPNEKLAYEKSPDGFVIGFDINCIIRYEKRIDGSETWFDENGNRIN